MFDICSKSASGLPSNCIGKSTFPILDGRQGFVLFCFLRKKKKNVSIEILGEPNQHAVGDEISIALENHSPLIGGLVDLGAKIQMV